jgi:hypothetical protein
MQKIIILILWAYLLFLYLLNYNQDKLIDNWISIHNADQSELIKYKNISTSQMEYINNITPINVIVKQQPEQNDILLKKSEWYCSLYGKKFTWQKLEHNEGFNTFNIGSTHVCVRLSRVGLI